MRATRPAMQQSCGAPAINPWATTRSATGSVSANSRNPETGNTWTGRGNEPAWIRGKPARPI
ncbi:H-NS family nucleoid-associated regulatory protein [Comamonas sp. GB3 AK4-5]|uniref:H-NS family nucleoid-associated regulatory protein n=1 Tax=Comamonas sp. GB3 AK4-5 TaxID=3231487 RepID=UPI00351E95B1